MAKKKKDVSGDKSDSQHDALEEVMAKARAKKQARAEKGGGSQGKADDDNQQFSEGREFDLKVEERDIDPTSRKALRDLLGADIESQVAKNIKKVKVYSPFRVYYDGPAASISAINGTGPFDILPGHKNFLSLLLPGDLVVRSPSGKEEKVVIDRGVMHVRNDTVHVFLDV